MIRELKDSLVTCLATFFVCVVGYTAVVWGLGQLASPDEAEGSLIHRRDRSVIGSELIAQPFTSGHYFHPRPSAVAYNASAAGASNLGTRNPKLRRKVAEWAEALKATADRLAPVDLVTTSGSGIDPYISPEAAVYQVARVAEARGLSVDRVRSLVAEHVETSGAILGDPPRVNVLKRNLDLDPLAKLR